MHKSYQVEGIVIKRSNLGEADRMLTLFSKDHGKVALLAKGVRKISSKRSGSLELFNWVKCQVTSGRGQLDILSEVELVESFPHWRKHLGRVTIAYQICEVVDKLTPDHEPHPEIFNILTQALAEISHLGADWEVKIKNLKLKILAELGYWPAEKIFLKDVDNFIEEISNKRFHSAKLLKRLK